jgi:hypothetical protein
MPLQRENDTFTFLRSDNGQLDTHGVRAYCRKKSIFNQRELDADVISYPMALKHVTQQSPDIIYIGNIRDVDTMRAAISAAQALWMSPRVRP